MTSYISSVYTPALSNGQLWIGNTSNTGLGPSAATLTPGTGISITNGAGSITISATGGGGSGVVVLAPTSSTTTLVNGTTFIPTNTSGACPFILPASPNPGEFYQVVGYGSAGWVIHQNASQQIILGSFSTTTGTAGNITSAQKTDGVIIYCITSTAFVALQVNGMETVNLN